MGSSEKGWLTRTEVAINISRLYQHPRYPTWDHLSLGTFGVRPYYRTGANRTVIFPNIPRALYDGGAVWGYALKQSGDQASAKRKQDPESGPRC